jgi:hypothetical protein
MKQWSPKQSLVYEKHDFDCESRKFHKERAMWRIRKLPHRFGTPLLFIIRLSFVGPPCLFIWNGESIKEGHGFSRAAMFTAREGFSP